jgi:hypothetical protein
VNWIIKTKTAVRGAVCKDLEAINRSAKTCLDSLAHCWSSNSSSRWLWARPAMTIVAIAMADSSQIMRTPVWEIGVAAPWDEP